MWPRRPVNREFLRIGRTVVERWVGVPGQLQFITARALPASSQEQAGTGRWPELDAALLAIYEGDSPTRATLLLESVLMPTLVVEAGPDLWAPSQMHALLQHRLKALHPKSHASAPWMTRIDFLAGERSALGFGLAGGVRDAVVRACAAAGIECRELLPVLAWGMNRIVRNMRHGWLAWPEHDRLLLAHIRGGRVTDLNAAAILTSDPADIARQVAIERLRRGIADASPIRAASWHCAPGAPAKDAGEVTWINIGNQTAAKGLSSRAHASGQAPA